MTLRNRAILEIDGVGPYDGTGVFEFRDIDSASRELDTNFLVGASGQVLSELYDQVSDIDPTDILPDSDSLDRRAGYHVDAGAGTDQWTISFTAGLDPEQRWGDGSTDPDDPGDIAITDAQGSRPVVKRDVLAGWLAQNLADSRGQMRLHIAEHTDGSYSDEAGLFGEAVPVVLSSVRVEVSTETTLDGTLELTRTTTVPDLAGSAEDVVDAVGDIISDF